jgi:hypothetical protein
VRRLLVAARVLPSSPIVVTLMKEALSSYETSGFTRATRRNIPEGGILLGRFTVSLERIYRPDTLEIIIVTAKVNVLLSVVLSTAPRHSEPSLSVFQSL